MGVADDPRVYDAIQFLAGRHVIDRRVRRILADASGATVLDVGAGTGTIAALLPAGAEYWALDNDPAKLERLERKVPAARRLLRSAVDTGLEDAAADWTVCVDVAHHLDDRELPGFARELARVTRNRLVFVDPLWSARPSLGRVLWRYDRGAHPRTAERLVQTLEAAFEIESTERFRAIHRYILCVCRPRRTAAAAAA
ncbi:MAG TPA: class I SAM-dependent methyltransferase [Conexibacter sp.]|jgi:SAM-dependent methyltransferase|nr:class I SAM-dependent methyltransferase [Conexibacter sp.]